MVNVGVALAEQRAAHGACIGKLSTRIPSSSSTGC